MNCNSTRMRVYLPVGFWLLSMLSWEVLAQDSNASLKLGETDLFPSVEISYISTNNAFLNPDNETSATGVAVAPRLEWVANRRLLELSLIYQGDYGTFSEDNLAYDDHSLRARVTAEPSSKQRVNAFFEVKQSHEELGRSNTRGIADENTDQVERTQFLFDVRGTYGAAGARGNLSGGLRFRGLLFSNQEALTDGEDSNRIEPYAVFSYRLSPSSRATAEIRYSNFEFGDAERDHDDVSVLGGIVLAEGRKTSGVARFGYTFAQFSDEDTSDEQGFIADVVLSYKPVSFSTFDLLVRKDFEQSVENNATQLAVQDEIRLDWRHNWSGKFRTDTFLRYSNRDFDCVSTDLEDVSAGVDFSFSIRRWLEFGAGVSTIERTSSLCSTTVASPNDLEFERQQVSAFVRIRL